MATSSFLNRWSQRKLERTLGQQDEEQLTNDPELILEDSHPQAVQVEDSTPAVDTESDPSSKVENTEEMSIASLLVSEASESVKKLRYASCSYPKSLMFGMAWTIMMTITVI